MEKETHWLRRALSPLHHKATEQEVLMGIWRVTGGTRLQNLASRSTVVCSSMPGNKLVGIRNRMGMKFVSSGPWGSRPDRLPVPGASAPSERDGSAL
eukprot:1161626-Pelagomonas_calceolata.AAC.5